MAQQRVSSFSEIVWPKFAPAFMLTKEWQEKADKKVANITSGKEDAGFQRTYHTKHETLICYNSACHADLQSLNKRDYFLLEILLWADIPQPIINCAAEYFEWMVSNQNPAWSAATKDAVLIMNNEKTNILAVLFLNIVEIPTAVLMHFCFNSREMQEHGKSMCALPYWFKQTSDMRQAFFLAHHFAGEKRNTRFNGSHSGVSFYGSGVLYNGWFFGPKAEALTTLKTHVNPTLYVNKFWEYGSNKSARTPEELIKMMQELENTTKAKQKEQLH